jgi:repressor LexA
MPYQATPTPVQLTPRQRQILEAISASQHSCGYSPTMAELAQTFGLSRSTVFEHMRELRAKGLLVTCPGKARSSSLTFPGQELLKRIRGHEADVTDRATGIPLMGQVAAGQPLEAIEDRQELSWHVLFGSDEGLFSLQVAGDSMIEEGIRPGDYVICRRTCVAHDGDLVVALIHGEEATLKRFYREAQRVRLEPANARYAPIYSDDCQIEAVVVGLLRQL